MPKLFKHVPCAPPSTTSCGLAFLGEAPADEEVIHGKVLIGPSGRVFDHMLRTANITREACWVGNVFDEQAPNNDASRWFQGGDLIESMRWHLDRLAKELSDAQPTVIVPMGSVALWALTGVTNISECRGAVAQADRVAPGVKLLPTLHPAHVIHDWRMFSVVVADMVKAARESTFAEVRFPQRNILIRPSLEEMVAFKRGYIDRAHLLSVDIETAAGQITCFGVGVDSTNAIVVPLVDMERPSRSYWPTTQQELEAVRWIKSVCECPTPKLLQNGPYDIQWLLSVYGIKMIQYLHDTRLLHHALYPELPKSLGFMGSIYANAGAWKMMRQTKADKRDA